MIKLSVVCCVLFLVGLTIADDVPFLAWGASVRNKPSYSAVGSTNGEEFRDAIGEPTEEAEQVYIFVFDQLTTEDFSLRKTPSGKSCFQGAQQVKDMFYIPSVRNSVEVFEDIAGEDKFETNIPANGDLSNLHNTEKKFRFISLAINGKGTECGILAQIDEIIVKLLKLKNVLICLTGKQGADHSRVKRQASSEAPATSSTTSATTSASKATTAATSVQPKQTATPPTFFKRDRLLMYYTAFEQVATNGTVTPITFETVTVGELTGGRIAVSMGAGVANTFEFNVSGDGGYWWVHDFQWNGQAILSNTRIAAVDTFSFHCSPSIVIATVNRATLLRWTGLQIQPELGTVADQTFAAFGDSWDCVGFVSPGIVGGLFVVIMLLFILSIGISWMMDINTMDRFDDPKGKTITISVNE